MAAKAANRVPCLPPLPTLDFAPAFEVYTELGIDLYFADFAHGACLEEFVPFKAQTLCCSGEIILRIE